MIDKEIIKALECCGNIVDSTCKGCVYHETYNASCIVRLMRDALDLINRQKSEITRLTQTLDIYAVEFDSKYASVKSETIKEFAEKLKKELEIALNEPIFDSIIGNIIESTIDELLEELTHQPKKIEHNSLCETETYESR